MCGVVTVLEQRGGTCVRLWHTSCSSSMLSPHSSRLGGPHIFSGAWVPQVVEERLSAAIVNGGTATAYIWGWGEKGAGAKHAR